MKHPSQWRDEATAYQEAGHAVIAIALEMRLRAVTIEPSDGRDGDTKRVAVPRISRHIESGEPLDAHDRVDAIKRDPVLLRRRLDPTSPSP